MAIIRQCVPTALVFSCLVFSCLVSGALAGKPTCPPDAARPMVELPLAGFKEAATVKLISDRALEAIARNGLSTTNATITVDITPGSPAGAAVARVRAFACAGSPEARPPVASSEPATPAAPVQPTEPPNGRKYTSPRSVADLLGPDIMRALERARHFELRQVAVPAGERNTDLVSYNVMSHALLLANEESDRLREILLRDPAAYLPPGIGRSCPSQPELLFEARDDSNPDGFATVQIVLSQTCMAARFMLNKDRARSAGVLYYQDRVHADLDELVAIIQQRTSAEHAAENSARPPATTHDRPWP